MDWCFSTRVSVAIILTYNDCAPRSSLVLMGWSCSRFNSILCKSRCQQYHKKKNSKALRKNYTNLWRFSSYTEVALNMESCHEVNFVIPDGNRDYHYDSLWCCLCKQKSWYHNNSQFSLYQRLIGTVVDKFVIYKQVLLNNNDRKTAVCDRLGAFFYKWGNKCSYTVF